MFYLCLCFTVYVMEKAAPSPTESVKVVPLMLAVLLMKVANRRHPWKEAAMGAFNKKAR